MTTWMRRVFASIQVVAENTFWHWFNNKSQYLAIQRHCSQMSNESSTSKSVSHHTRMQSPFDYKLDWNLVKWKAVAKGNVQRHYSTAKTSSSRLNVRRFLKLCNYYYYHRFSILHQPLGCRHGTVSANTNNNIQSTPTHDYVQHKAHPVICYSLFFYSSQLRIWTRKFVN